MSVSLIAFARFLIIAIAGAPSLEPVAIFTFAVGDALAATLFQVSKRLSLFAPLIISESFLRAGSGPSSNWFSPLSISA